jgi:mannose-6-phosphate isomerase-like protein (cupin superfamily)
MAKGYAARHLAETEPVPCPCGQSWRIFTRQDSPVANVHVTSIQDSRRHYHQNCTEFYYILEGEGILEVGGDALKLSPGLLVRIDPGTPHRGHGDFKALILGVPAWDPADEFFADE